MLKGFLEWTFHNPPRKRPKKKKVDDIDESDEDIAQELREQAKMEKYKPKKSSFTMGTNDQELIKEKINFESRF